MINYKVYSLSELLNNYEEDELKSTFRKFSCQRETDLEDFLVNKSIEYEKIRYGMTFLIVDAELLESEAQFKIIGFFTIGLASIDISELSQKKRRKVIGSSIPRRDTLNTIPCFLIGQLGRDDSYLHDDLSGEMILQECYAKVEDARIIVGGNLVVLDCREKMMDAFYSKQGFKELNPGTNDKGLKTLYRKIQ